jgi:hypothetical protein
VKEGKTFCCPKSNLHSDGPWKRMSSYGLKDIDLVSSSSSI